MISREQQALLQGTGRSTRLGVAFALGCIAALTVPALCMLGGMLVDILAAPEAPGSMHFGKFLPNPRRLIPEELSPLSQVCVVLALAMGILMIQVVCLFLFYRRIQNAAVQFEVAAIERLWEHSKQLALVRTLSGQQTALVDGLEYHLPRVRASFSRWWRAAPRHYVQLALCLLLAMLITPVLALMTVVAAAIVVMVYRTLDRYRRTQLPVVRERATQQRSQVISLCLTGPLLESVHTAEDVQKSFQAGLAVYRSEAVRSLASSAWKTPVVIALTGMLGCLFVFLVSIQVLRPEHELTLASCVTFLLAAICIAISCVRLQRSRRELRSVQTASEDLLRFLSLPATSLPVLDAKVLKQVQQHVILEHVTLQDSSGRKLLENVSAHFEPGKLVGIVASQRLQASALLELLLGIGRPVSGRMLIDGLVISDLDPAALKRLGLWVAADGSLVTGTVQENLLGDRQTPDSDQVVEALKAARAFDAIRSLPNGPATLITAADDRFTADTPFRLGIARAILRSASIVVLEEPNTRVDNKTEQETIEAMRAVCQAARIVVVWPQRLQTLRQCDQIILLHDHHVASVGTHAELLQTSDLYRHLNYVRFSPLRHVTV